MYVAGRAGPVRGPGRANAVTRWGRGRDAGDRGPAPAAAPRGSSGRAGSSTVSYPPATTWRERLPNTSSNSWKLTPRPYRHRHRACTFRPAFPVSLNASTKSGRETGRRRGPPTRTGASSCMASGSSGRRRTPSGSAPRCTRSSRSAARPRAPRRAPPGARRSSGAPQPRTGAQCRRGRPGRAMLDDLAGGIRLQGHVLDTATCDPGPCRAAAPPTSSPGPDARHGRRECPAHLTIAATVLEHPSAAERDALGQPRDHRLCRSFLTVPRQGQVRAFGVYAYVLEERHGRINVADAGLA